LGYLAGAAGPDPETPNSESISGASEASE